MITLMSHKGFANIIILILVVIGIVGAGGYLVLNRQVPSQEPSPITSTDIQLQSHFEVLGFGKYKDRSSNTPFFIDARILSLPNAASAQFYKLCGSDENSAMSIFTKYLANENRDIILDDPNKTPEQKKQRMVDGYGTWHLIDRWKADTHFHYVIATAGESNPRHIILEDCNYFTPTTVYSAQTIGADYSSPIGTFKYSPRTTDSFLAFLKYYYGRQQSNYIFENKLHNVSAKEQADIITISFKVVTVNYGDWGMGTTYTYSTVTHTLDKKTGNMNVTWKTDAQTSGHIDENLLK
jgi:hypothetical protein